MCVCFSFYRSVILRSFFRSIHNKTDFLDFLYVKYFLSLKALAPYHLQRAIHSHAHSPMFWSRIVMVMLFGSILFIHPFIPSISNHPWSSVSLLYILSLFFYICIYVLQPASLVIICLSHYNVHYKIETIFIILFLELKWFVKVLL